MPNTAHTKEHLDEDVKSFLAALDRNRAIWASVDFSQLTVGTTPEVAAKLSDMQSFADYYSLASIAWDRVGGAPELAEDRKVWRLLICREAARRYTEQNLNEAIIASVDSAA
ncbi:hypothetical protein [Bradyrhizobium sp. RT10b]|uniref:hypothetical protein n=1 Tax=Bradyrhizobium sp. RT10b TaxID=3156331 RepID=UPI003399D37B